MKRLSPRSAFFNRRILIGVALSSVALLLALFASALYPGGKALASDFQAVQSDAPAAQDDTGTPAIEDAQAILGTIEISLPEQPELSSPPNDMPDGATPLVSCIATALPNNGGITGYERAPHTGYRFGRSVYLITQAELAASNYLPGSAPDSIGFNYHTAPGLTGAAPLIVYMQNTTDTANNKSGTWSTAISGMTVVHNATTTLRNVTGPFDITFAGGSPFTYSGGGLYIAFDWGQYTGTLSTTVLVYCNTSLISGLLGNQSNTAAPTTVAASNFRPETRLGSSIQNDVAATGIYSFGELPRGLVPAQNIKGVITNR